MLTALNAIALIASAMLLNFWSMQGPDRVNAVNAWWSNIGIIGGLLLLSATVGNAAEFINWLDRCHGRKVELVESNDRKVPLAYQYVPNQFLGELLVDMAKGTDETRKTPALVFCFNRDECWATAEMLKGLDVRNAMAGQR